MKKNKSKVTLREEENLISLIRDSIADIQTLIKKQKDENELSQQLSDVSNRIISEIRSFNQVEQVITQKANDAVARTNHRLNTILGCVTLVGFLGIVPILSWYRDHVVKTVTLRFATDAVQSVINTEVPKMVSPQINSMADSLRKGFCEEVSNAVHTIQKRENDLKEKLIQSESYIDIIAKIHSARAGWRLDYDELGKIAKGTNSISVLAANARKEIQQYYTERKYQFGGMRITLTRDKGNPLKGNQMLVALVRNDADHNTDGAITELSDTGNKQFVATLIFSVKSSRRLESVYRAIRGIEKLTKVDFPGIGISEVLSWWDKNSQNPIYHSAYEKFWDFYENSKRPSGENADILEEIKSLHSIIKEVPDAYLAASVLLSRALSVGGRLDKSKENCRIIEFALDYYGKIVPKPNDWYIYKALYLVKVGEIDNLHKICKDRIKDNPEFIDELKRVGFTDAFFQLIDISNKSSPQK